MYVRKTTNKGLIERLDVKIFGEEESEDSYDGLWWVAYVDGKIAGFAGMSVFTERGVSMGYLRRTGILRSFRGLGLQRALIDCRDREAKRLGIKETVTYTARDNHPSANNLIRCGYELYTPQSEYGLKGALYFCKTITR